MANKVDQLIELLRKRDNYIIKDDIVPEVLIAEIMTQLSYITHDSIERFMRGLIIPHDIGSTRPIYYVVEVTDNSISRIGLTRMNQSIFDNLDYTFDNSNSRYTSNLSCTKINLGTYPKLRQIIKYIHQNRKSKEFSNLADILEIQKDNICKKEVAEALPKLIPILPFYYEVSCDFGKTKIIPVKLVQMSNGLYRPIICFSIEDVIYEILHNDSKKHIQLYSRNTYDRNGRVVRINKS